MSSIVFSMIWAAINVYPPSYSGKKLPQVSQITSISNIFKTNIIFKCLLGEHLPPLWAGCSSPSLSVSAASSSSPLKVGFAGRPAPQAASFHEPAQVPWGSCQKAGSDSEVPEGGLQFCISDTLPPEGLAAALWTPSIYLGRLKALLLCVIYEYQLCKWKWGLQAPSSWLD